MFRAPWVWAALLFILDLVYFGRPWPHFPPRWDLFPAHSLGSVETRP